MKFKTLIISAIVGVFILTGCTTDKPTKVSINKEKEKTVQQIETDNKKIQTINTEVDKAQKCVKVNPKTSEDPAYQAMMDPTTETGKAWQAVLEADEKIYQASVKSVAKANKDLEEVTAELEPLEKELKVLEEKLNNIPNDESHKMERLLLENGELFRVKQKIETRKNTIHSLTTVIKSGEEANKAYEEYKECMNSK